MIEDLGNGCGYLWLRNSDPRLEIAVTEAVKAGWTVVHKPVAVVDDDGNSYVRYELRRL
jgi:hypothetical protein